VKKSLKLYSIEIGVISMIVVILAAIVIPQFFAARESSLHKAVQGRAL
jgi:type II secretory pathway pseudopilin PulG